MYLQIRPGTDVVLGYALAAELERIGGIDEAFVAEWVTGYDAYMREARSYSVERASDICVISIHRLHMDPPLGRGARNATFDLSMHALRGNRCALLHSIYIVTTTEQTPRIKQQGLIFYNLLIFKLGNLAIDGCCLWVVGPQNLVTNGHTFFVHR